MPRPGPSRSLVRLLALAAVGTGLLVAQGCMRWPLANPDLRPFRHLTQPGDTGAVTVRFMGTTSFLFTDRDSTSILMEGFVSRPGLDRVAARRFRPDCKRIGAAWDRMGHPPLAMVFTGHSHYDHAMDAPVWAQITGAELLGALSTRMIGRGLGLPASQTRLVSTDTSIRIGKFELTFIESAHGTPDRFPGSVAAPLRLPAKRTEWKTGLVYSVFVRHSGRTLLVTSTAGYKPGALRGRRADVVYLAIGGLGRRPMAEIDAYWTEVVRATGARRAILVHWDDFFRPLQEPLQGNIYGLPVLLEGDDVPRAMGRILELAAADSVDVRLPPLWTPANPFADLSLPVLPDTVFAPHRIHAVPDSTYCPNLAPVRRRAHGARGAAAVPAGAAAGRP